MITLQPNADRNLISDQHVCLMKQSTLLYITSCCNFVLHLMPKVRKDCRTQARHDAYLIHFSQLIIIFILLNTQREKELQCLADILASVTMSKT